LELIRPFKKALVDAFPRKEIEQVVEAIRGVGLRLNLPGPAEVLLAEGVARPRTGREAGV
jgi:hypothetical protein